MFENRSLLAILDPILMVKGLVSEADGHAVIGSSDYSDQPHFWPDLLYLQNPLAHLSHFIRPLSPFLH